VNAPKTPAGTSRYAVTETAIVPPSDAGALEPASGRDLTLVACYPVFYVGKATKGFIVHARRVG
jgi:LPXTG-site transpeptidase (sortase) family protein